MADGSRALPANWRTEIGNRLAFLDVPEIEMVTADVLALIESWHTEPSPNPDQELRTQLEQLVTASLEPCDYTQEPHDGAVEYEPTDYTRATANITEMHRLLILRSERLMDADDDRRAARRALDTFLGTEQTLTEAVHALIDRCAQAERQLNERTGQRDYLITTANTQTPPEEKPT